MLASFGPGTTGGVPTGGTLGAVIGGTVPVGEAGDAPEGGAVTTGAVAGAGCAPAGEPGGGVTVDCPPPPPGAPELGVSINAPSDGIIHAIKSNLEIENLIVGSAPLNTFHFRFRFRSLFDLPTPSVRYECQGCQSFKSPEVPMK